ncbi:DinB family protein [Streptomyces sp. 35M1]|uniref:DinB family protein n=1 Tax=Streptomyces sp. 35M1 TaxID=3142978 RepID=UPI0039908AB7
MTLSQPKADLQRYLQSARDALLWKLEGLSEYDVRRPLTPTGTNILGLVKHAAGVELGYFGDTFGRPFGEVVPAFEDDAEANQDMWATADESRADILALHRRVTEHADATIAELPLDAVGRVPWWPDDRNRVTLHRILVHVISDLQRHAGHADIVRELVDGAVGMRSGNENMPPGDRVWWEGYRQRLEQAARDAR